MGQKLNTLQTVSAKLTQYPIRNNNTCASCTHAQIARSEPRGTSIIKDSKQTITVLNGKRAGVCTKGHNSIIPVSQLHWKFIQCIPIACRIATRMWPRNRGRAAVERSAVKEDQFHTAIRGRKTLFYKHPASTFHFRHFYTWTHANHAMLER